MGSSIDHVPAYNPRSKAVEGPLIVKSKKGKKVAHIGGSGGNRVSRWITGLYDFTVQGGAAGAITLTDEDGAAVVLPAGAILLRAISECVVAATSGGGATIALGWTGTAAGLLAATAYTDNKFDTVGEYGATIAALPTNTLSADASLLATIATADLTAGKFKVHVEILEGETS